jgi:glycosyltransferase involved in cell wall biosynthesis
MKVAYFINAYPKVSHTFIRREIQALEAQGVNIARYSLRSSPDELVDAEDQAEFQRTRYVFDQGKLSLLVGFLALALRQPLVMLKVLPTAWRIGLGSERGLLRHFAYVVEAARLAGWCREDGVSHVHAHFGTNSATVVMFVSMLTGLPFSFTAHGADEIDGARNKDMKLKLERAAFVIGVSWYVRSQLIRRMPYDQWDKIRIVHCGLGNDFLRAEPAPLPGQGRFVCVGRLCEEKAQYLLVSAMAKLKQQGLNASLVLAGDGPLRPQIERLIDQAGVRDRVQITGWISGGRVQHELQNADMLVLPSLIEGLPVAIMEALALGRPVISTYIAGIPELVEAGRNGWLVPAGDLEALTAAMAEAAATPTAVLARMGQHGTVSVRERHDAAIEAGKLKRLFEASP